MAQVGAAWITARSYKNRFEGEPNRSLFPLFRLLSGLHTARNLPDYPAEYSSKKTHLYKVEKAKIELICAFTDGNMLLNTKGKEQRL